LDVGGFIFHECMGQQRLRLLMCLSANRNELGVGLR
jgi:hypothetical protein